MIHAPYMPPIDALMTLMRRFGSSRLAVVERSRDPARAQEAAGVLNRRVEAETAVLGFTDEKGVRCKGSYRIVSFQHTAGLREAVSRDLLEEVNRRTGRNFSLAARLVRQGMMAGIFRPGDPREVVDFLWALLTGLVQLMEIRRNLGLAVGDLAELHKHAFALLEDGLSQPRGSAPGGRPRPLVRQAEVSRGAARRPAGGAR